MLINRIFVVLCLMLFATQIAAQQVLEDGVTVEGEITDEVFAVEYTYQGLEGQVIVLELFPTDTRTDYNNPSIILLNSEGEELMRRDGFGRTTAIYPLPADDTYTIIASRRDDAQGVSVGDYTLLLTVPPELELEQPLDVTITSDDTLYYVYRGEADFNLLYARTGDFAPEVSVNTIDLRVTVGSLRATGGLYGASVTQGVIGTFDGGEIYVIKLNRPLFAISFGVSSADVILELFQPR